jgi:carboxyl-terminal processing protease
VGRDLIFEYGNKFFLENKEIDNPRSFRLSDDQYEKFVKWLQDKEFDYTTFVEKSLDDLEKYAQREKYFDEIKPTIEALRDKVSHNKEQDLITFQNEIREALREELVSRYYFQEGVIEASLVDDSEVKAALDILSSPARISGILASSAK